MYISLHIYLQASVSLVMVHLQERNHVSPGTKDQIFICVSSYNFSLSPPVTFSRFHLRFRFSNFSVLFMTLVEAFFGSQ